MIHGQKRTQQHKSQEQLKEQLDLSIKINTKLGQFFKIRKQPIDNNNINKLSQFTSILMQLCPDITTIYNYRRELIQKLLASVEDSQQKIKILSKQMKFLTKIIQEDSKSYTLWSYRQWLVLLLYQLDQSIVKKEKQLCKMLLVKDQKNFHVWNYRSWANTIQMNIDQELSFTRDKINANPFNFSPYHFRSKHLSKKYNNYYQHQCQSCCQTSQTIKKQIVVYGMPKQTFDAQLQMIKTAIFLNPKEQAPWLYYSWILKQLIPALLLTFQGNRLLFSLKVSNIQQLINEKITSLQTHSSNTWKLETQTLQNITIPSNMDTTVTIQTTGRRLIGTTKFNETDILNIFQKQQKFLKQVIESQDNKCRFGWLQLLELYKNIIYLGTAPEKWQQITGKSLIIFQNLANQKGSKYIAKQKQYWQRLLIEDKLSEVQKGLKYYRK